MSTFFTLITNAGLAKLAYANSLGQGVNWTHMAVGDGNGSAVNPSLTQTALVRERYRAPITNEFYDPTKPLQRNVELVIPANVGGWTAREAGIFDSDGVLVAVCNLPESYKPTLPEGSEKDLGVRMIIEHSNASIINIVIDPSVVLASRQWVEASFLPKTALSGGTTRQVLRKKSNSELDFEWFSLDPITVSTPGALPVNAVAFFLTSNGPFTLPDVTPLVDGHRLSFAWRRGLVPVLNRFGSTTVLELPNGTQNTFVNCDVAVEIELYLNKTANKWEIR